MTDTERNTHYMPNSKKLVLNTRIAEALAAQGFAWNVGWEYAFPSRPDTIAMVPHDFTNPHWLIPALVAWCDAQGWNYSSYYLGENLWHWQLIPNPDTIEETDFTWPSQREGRGYEPLAMMFAEALDIVGNKERTDD